MKQITLFLAIALFSTLLWAQTPTHIVVITHENSEIKAVNKSQLRNMFMGTVSFSDITPIALAPGEVARSVFNVRVVGLTESRIQAYWAQMRFSGRQQRPVEASSPQEAILMVQSTPNTITYVPEGTPLPADIKIIYRSSDN